MKTACVTGATGQIGSYLCEILLRKGYEIQGLKYDSCPDYMNSSMKNSNLKLLSGDITDSLFMQDWILRAQPNLFINCAAQSNVVASFEKADYTMQATGDAVINCLHAIKQHSPYTKFVTLGSALMFGDTPAPQSELGPFDPKSPYAKAKLMAHEAVCYYRNSGLFVCNAICFNSESPRRGEDYVTRKITMGAARIKYGLQDKLVLGNLQSIRDFSHAQDTANAIYKIVTHNTPDDFVIASGQTHSIQEIVEIVFTRCGLNWQDYVVIDPKYFRGTKENTLCGDTNKIRTQLSWTPKYSFTNLIEEMIDHDLGLVEGMAE